MIPDEELKDGLQRTPLSTVGEQQRIDLSEIPEQTGLGVDVASLTQRMQAFGYTRNRVMLEPMLRELRDPLGSWATCISRHVRKSLNALRLLQTTVCPGH